MPASDTTPAHDPEEFTLAQEPSAFVTWWRATGQWLTAALITLALAWLTFTRDGWVPLLSGADLGVHEAGHLLFMWAPRPLMSFGGTLLQLAVPALFGLYFWRRHDRFAAVLMIAWTAENLNNVSVYIHDATRLALPLFGDIDGTASGHDWRYLLGPDVLNALGASDAIAWVVRGLSIATFGLALWLALAPLIAPRVALAEAERREAALRARRKKLPVREPRNPVVATPARDEREPGEPSA